MHTACVRARTDPHWMTSDMNTNFSYDVHAGDIEQGGSASAALKSELRKIGICEEQARRAGIIVFEGEMNLLVYATNGGTVNATVTSEAITITIEDAGPGIADIDLAMTPGYSTAPDWALNLGFGAGMGLVNMQRNSNFFEIHSHTGKGTLIRCRVNRRKNDAAD